LWLAHNQERIDQVLITDVMEKGKWMFESEVSS
jgi:hypothetical protein